MRKDTESLGNDKAPACESRGFVHKKKEGVYFDTPPFFLCKYLWSNDDFPSSRFLCAFSVLTYLPIIYMTSICHI